MSWYFVAENVAAVNEAPYNEELDVKEEPLDPQVSYCTYFNQT